MDTNRPFELTTELKQIISTDQAWYYKIIPCEVADNTFGFFFSPDEVDENELANELQVILGKDIKLTITSRDWIIEQLNRLYPRDERESGGGQLKELVGNSSADMLGRMIEEAARIKSSDIHLETYEERCRIRFRIDGRLVERYVIEKTDYPALVNKIKIKSNLDISEKRLPQDGRVIYTGNGRKFDIRVSILPTLHGEKIVLRLLNRDATQIDLNFLGFQKEQLKEYLEGVKRPNGIVLISGPTGSGKTTTLYATLKLLNREATNILTIEDPIEYTLEGINQVQLKEAIGLDFASAMRTFLRQDPDIIMVGEIRDAETAQMAIRAALTGHLVLSTIHTNSAWGTITRLVDMGIAPYLVASTLNLSVAQRLIRKLCPHCKTKEPFDQQLYPPGFKPLVSVDYHMVPKGCPSCYYTGYKGRQALYEIIPVDIHLKEKIRHEEFNVNSYLAKQNIALLSDIAFKLFQEGVTSLDEVYPILSQQ
jgi:type IV pilus assembly protein PilB